MQQERIIVSLEMPKDLKEALNKEAEEKEMTVSALIRFILKQHLKEK